MEAEPNQLVSPSDPGSGTVDEGAPSITLGLGIGSGLVVKEAVSVAVARNVNVIFTAAQLRELEQQWLIFKYIAAGLPVPLHLAVPIWKSIAIATANSSGSARPALCHQYPNSIGFSLKGLDYRSMMDPEPWRCRRTDGKKWRCSKNVVPDQKYCERHMHRGRQRSRKPVEASQNAVSSNTAVPTNSENLNTKLSIATPVNLQLMTPLSTSANHSIGAATSNELNRTVRQNKNIATTISITNYENDKNNHDIYRKNRNHVDNKDFCVGDNIIVGKSIGLSFSPNSVLQGYRSVCCGKGKVEVEAGRCRRTDGKKWRCSRDVVPNEKYCGRHMHRGVKKPVTISSPQLGANDEKVSTSSSSSSSDTTITDASITAACENG